MIPEFAEYALILAFCFAIIQATLPLLGILKLNRSFMELSCYAAIGQLLFVGFSFFALGYAFITNDFSVVYVAQNSNTSLPWFYRFCAIWGAHEGSLLLWVFILAIWTAAVSVFNRKLPIELLSCVLSVLGFIAIGFYLLLLTQSNPFVRILVNIPANGNDLNPILQDPGLVAHPPMLYMGYVGFSVVFAFGVAALMSGRFDAVWAKWSRPWALMAWCFLTLGIVLGSWWAYRDLGWGGWWFWDPVENASFLPWLVGTALIHSLVVTAKRNVFQAWTILLSVCAFSLSLLGTFLVRSGVLISVHAFAVDPARGVFILRFLTIMIGGSLLLYAWRARRISKVGQFNFWSRETMLLANNVILFVAMTTILLGTLYPMIIDALNMGKISVGAPYFNIVFVPLMIPLLLLIGIGPQFYWRNHEPKILCKRFIVILILVLIIAIALPAFVGAAFKFSAFIGLALGFWIILNMIAYVMQQNSSRQWSLFFAHVGIAVTVIGIALTTAYSEQRNISLKIGDSVNVGPYIFHFKKISHLEGPNYTGAQATVVISKGKKELTVLHPQDRLFTVENSVLSKTAINSTLFRDLYVALGRPLPGGAWGMRIYYKPFVRWIWYGGFLMILGGIIAIVNRRYRVSRGEEYAEKMQ